MANLLALARVHDPKRYSAYVKDLTNAAKASLKRNQDADAHVKAIRLLSDLTVADVALPA